MTDDVLNPEAKSIAPETLPDGGTPELQPENKEQPNGESAPETLPVEDPKEAVNRRFSTITRERDEARRMADEAQRRLYEAQDALKATNAKPAETTPQDDPEPEEPTFESPEQYQRDMAAYVRQMTERTARVAVRAAHAESERARSEIELRSRQNAIQQAWQQRREKAMADMPDYAEVAERPDVPISQAMASVITTQDAGPRIAYYLGQHPEEAARISGLSPVEQIVELGALRERILTPSKPTPSRVPPPIKTLKGSTTPASKSPDDMSMEEYAASRRRS